MILEAFEGRDWSSFFSDRPVSPFLDLNEEMPFALRLGSAESLITPAWGRGYSTGQKAYTLFKSLTAKIPSHLDFDRLPIPFRAGAVEIPSGDFQLFDSGDIAEAIRSSMSIQGIFEPFVIDGRSYVDGGLLNNLPVQEVREMGYDIIIAVDLFSPPAEFSVSPVNLANLMSTLYSYQTSKHHHEFADAVFFPISIEASIMDFARGYEIYVSAREKREELTALLEPIRQRTGTAARAASYKDMPLLSPKSLLMRGALSRDRSYIEKLFSSFILGKALEEQNIAAFLDGIYETGNYQMVTSRIDTLGGETHLELILYPERRNLSLFRLGVDYEGTFSSRYYNWAALRSGIEFVGMNGSSLFIRTSIMDELAIGFSVFRPLSPNFFIAAEADLVREQTLVIKGILDSEEIIAERILYFHGALRVGLRFNRHNSLIISPDYYWFRNDDEYSAMLGFATAYTYSSLDHSLFPSRGFRGKLENRLRFASDLSPLSFKPFDLLSIDLKTAIPLGGYFNIGLSAYVSSLFGEPDLPPEISAFGNDKVQRIYFPHTSDLFYGENRAAFSLALNFEPRQNLTPLGGKLVFSLTAAGGRTGSFEWSDWSTPDKDEFVWNTSFGIGLVPVRYFGLQLRAGAGGGVGYKPTPFVSLDVGMTAFQRGLF